MKTQPAPITEKDRESFAAFVKLPTAVEQINDCDDAEWLATLLECLEPSNRCYTPAQERVRVLERLHEIQEIRDNLTDEKRELRR